MPKRLPLPDYAAIAEALRPVMKTRLFLGAALHCEICLTGFDEFARVSSYEPAPDFETQFESLLVLLSHRGWSITEFRDAKEIKTGLACGSCSRMILEPKAKPTRLEGATLLQPFNRAASDPSREAVLEHRHSITKARREQDTRDHAKRLAALNRAD